MLWLLIPAFLVIFLAVLLLRAAAFKPAAEEKFEEDPIDLDHDRIVESMQQMIRCKTVSNRYEDLVDKNEFKKFRDLLKDRYPLIHKTATLTRCGETGVLYHIPGKSSEKASVCMAHYDVVPVVEEMWTVPAFDGLVKDGCIWGRGTLDTKGTLCGLMEALEKMLSDGFVPANDLYLSFSGDEEVDGNSCPAIVDYLEEHGIRPAIVVDEGGAVVENVFPGVKRECAVVGIAEKGGLNYDFILEAKPGHASTPPTRQSLGKLARAIVNIEKKPFPSRLTKPAAEMFDTLGRHSTFLYRLIFANLWCFKGVLDMICKASGGELNALMRTTVALTRAQGSDAYNVLPAKASFGINTRVLPGESNETVMERLKKTIHNDEIDIRFVSGTEPSPCSETSGEAWDILKRAIAQTWTEAIVSPYLMMACSDSRHYCRISDHVYRFCAMKLSKEERGMIHGHDERVLIETMVKTAEFYVRLLRQL